MKKCRLQSSVTQWEDLKNSDSNQRVEETTKLTDEFLKNIGGVTDNAGGVTGLLMKGGHSSLMTRCALKTIKKIRKNLDDENLEKFEQSCFGHLLKLNQLNQLRFQGRLMWQLLLHMDMGLSNKERLVFKVKDSSIVFGPSDFSLITGLLCYGMSEVTTSSPSSIHENVFQSRPWLRLKDVKKAFITASRDNEDQDERTLKLAMLYFLYGILLPRNNRITTMDMKYLHLVEDLEKFNAFPWGRVAFEFLAKSILSIRDRMDGSEVTSKQFDMLGFTYALQIWAYEVMPSVATYCAARANNLGYLTPRILCWSATKQKQLRSDHLKELFTLRDKAHLKIGIGKRTTPLSRRQPKKRKLKRDKDIMPRTTRNILLKREKGMRIKLDELKVEKLKSDKAAEHYKKRLEDLVAKVDCCAAAATKAEAEAEKDERTKDLVAKVDCCAAAATEAEKDEKTKNLAGGKAQHEDAMSAEVHSTCDYSIGSGSTKRATGSRSMSPSRAAEDCSAVAVQDNQGKESEIKGCSDGEVTTGKMACPSSAAGVVIIDISDSDDEIPDMSIRLTSKRKIRQPSAEPSGAAADDDDDDYCDFKSLLQKIAVDSSDDESCSDAHMDNLVATLQRKAKQPKMDICLQQRKAKQQKMDI